MELELFWEIGIWIYFMLKEHYALQISIKRFRNDYRYYKITSFKLKKIASKQKFNSSVTM